MFLLIKMEDEEELTITNEILFTCVLEIAVLLSTGFKSMEQLETLFLNHYALKNNKFDEAFVQATKKKTVDNFGSLEEKPYEVFTYFKITAFAYEQHQQCAIILKNLMNNKDFLSKYISNLDENVEDDDDEFDDIFNKLFSGVPQGSQGPPRAPQAPTKPETNADKINGLSGLTIKNEKPEKVKQDQKKKEVQPQVQEPQFKRIEYVYPEFSVTQQEDIDEKYKNYEYQTRIDPFQLAKEVKYISNHDLNKFKSDEKKLIYNLLDKKSKKKLDALLKKKEKEMKRLVAKVAKGSPVSYEHLQDINEQIKNFSLQYIKKTPLTLAPESGSVSSSESESESESESDSSSVSSLSSY